MHHCESFPRLEAFSPRCITVNRQQDWNEVPPPRCIKLPVNRHHDWNEGSRCSAIFSTDCSQVVAVKKKDGKSRVCIHYRRLNRKLIKDNYPLPLIDDILDCLQNAKIFTTLDLKNGFFHVAVNERSRKFTSFVTHNGQYQFRRMPFGLSTYPSTFMRYINAIFRHLISKSIVLPYMDDVVIPAANESQALEYLKIVLEVAYVITDLK
ncbi:hypothetical protein TNCV_3091711 [Trichonephila clavipes]|nr:hypothetical protein TNCV_3091711 [Trichonephila clavipes]